MATLGPDSFVISEGSGAVLSSGSGMTEGMSSSNIIGGGSNGLMIDASGAMMSVKQNMDAVDELAKLAKGIIDPKIEKMQKELIWKGVQRAANGESMDDVRGDTPWLSRMLNTGFMVKGAASYKASSALSDLARKTSDDEEIKAMGPEEFRSWWVNSVEGLKIGDPDVDAIIEGQALQLAPQVFKSQGLMYEEKVRTDLEREHFNYNVKTAESIAEVTNKLSTGKISQEEAQTQISILETEITAKKEGETDEAYARRLQVLAKHSATNGNFSVMSVLKKSGVYDNLPPNDQAAIREYEDVAFQQALRNIESKNPGAIASFKVLIAQANTPEEREQYALAFNDFVQLQAGITGPGFERLQAVDVVKVMETGRLEFAKVQAEEQKRINDYHAQQYMTSHVNLIRSMANNAVPPEIIEAHRQKTSDHLVLNMGMRVEDLDSSLKEPHVTREMSESEQRRRDEKLEAAREKIEEEEKKKAEEISRIKTTANNIALLRDTTMLAGLTEPEKQMAVNEALQIFPGEEARILTDVFSGGSAGVPFVDTNLQIRFKQPFTSQVFDYAKLSGGIALYDQILSDKDYGQVAVLKLYGADTVEKIEKWKRLMQNPDNLKIGDRLFKETFGHPSLVGKTYTPNKDDIAHGSSFADKISVDKMAHFTSLENTSSANKQFITEHYSRARAEIRALYPNDDERTINLKAEQLASQRFEFYGGNTLIGKGPGMEHLTARGSMTEGTQLSWNDKAFAETINELREEKTFGREDKTFIKGTAISEPSFVLQMLDNKPVIMFYPYVDPGDGSGPQPKSLYITMDELRHRYPKHYANNTGAWNTIRQGTGNIVKGVFTGVTGVMLPESLENKVPGRNE